MNRKRILFITQTAVMLALLVGVQFVTRSFGQFVTGSLVNLILLVSVMVVGTGSGLVVAVISNFLAFGIGIGPVVIQIVPFVAVGNVILVAVAHFAKRNIPYKGSGDVVITVIVFFTASVLKTLFLWVVLVAISLPLIPGITEKQIAALTATFTWPQLVTSLIGSLIAIILVPALKRALRILMGRSS